MPERVLLGDIGGTNARFALLDGARLGPTASVVVEDHPRFDQAVAAFLGRSGARVPVSGAVLAVAGAVEKNHASITQHQLMGD